MAAVDDYLEVRPEQAVRLRRLAAARRLSVGPWYVLMDEFLVSGETIVRNLQLGLERAAAFGGAMEVGYLPDMFGHIAQMPQLLRSAGFDHAVVWRGVPAAIERTGFHWRSPDGSTVRAEYLLTGYSAGASVADDAKALIRRLTVLEAERAEYLPGPDAPILFPNGTDHQRPQPWLGRVVAEADALQDHFDISCSSLEDYLAEAPTEGLPSVEGELRSGARANVLMGVASNRVDVKMAAAAAERQLERTAEPLAALLLGPQRYPSALFAIAWRELIRNSAHDSICACSHDDVGAAVLHRYHEARAIADVATERALAVLSVGLEQQGHAVVNPSARARSGTVELVLSGEGPVEGAQVLAERVGLAAALVLSTTEVRGILGQIDGYDQIGDGAYITGVDVDEDDAGIGIAVRVGPERREDLARRRHQVRPPRPPRTAPGRAGARPARPGGVAPRGGAGRGRPALRLDVVVAGTARRPGQRRDRRRRGGHARERDDLGGLLPGRRHLLARRRGRVQPARRRRRPRRHLQLLAPEHDTVVDAPVEVSLEVEAEGPVRAVVVVRRAYDWPEQIDDGARRRVGTRRVEVTSRVELRAGERLVRVETSLHNLVKDHRVRAHFPLPERAMRSSAECAYGVVERGLVAEGGPSERPLATYPSRRFVHAGGLAVCHDGLLEYELVDLEDGTAGELAITLVRSTGMLSRLTSLNRPLPAGPTDPAAGAQLQVPLTLRYAVAAVASAIDGYRLAEDAFEELLVAPTFGGGDLPAEHSALGVTGAEVAAVHRTADGALEVRLFNPTPVPSRVELRGPTGPLAGSLVDLRGRFVASFEGAFELGAHAIATLRPKEH